MVGGSEGRCEAREKRACYFQDAKAAKMQKHSENILYRKAEFARESTRARRSRMAAARGPVPFVCLCVVIQVSGALPGAAAASGLFVPHYTIIDLGTLGGFGSAAFGINELGQVCGGADRSDGRRRAFLWTDGEMIDLGTFAQATQGEANDVNNKGQVTGTLFSNGGGVVGGFFWDAGEITNLGNLTGNDTGDTSAKAINDSGQIVGRSRISLTVVHAFLWQDGVMTDLTANGFSTGIAWDISNAGHIVGGPCLWEDGVLTDLGSLGGRTGAKGMNELRQVVGGSERVLGSANFYAFLWDDGEIIDLDFGPGGIAEAINSSGQVIIPSRFLFDPQHGVLDLSDLIPPDSGWFSLSVYDINDAGQIVGAGTFNGARRGFLMTPIPPPSAIPAVSAWGTVVLILLLLCGGAIVGRRLNPTPFGNC